MPDIQEPLVVPVDKSQVEGAGRAMDGMTRSAVNLEKQIERTNRDLLEMTADFRTGRLGAEEYARSMRVTREQLLGLSGSIRSASDKDLAGFNRLLQQTETASNRVEKALATVPPVVDNVEKSSRRAGLTINALRSPLATLATHALGATGSLGQLGSVLISLTAGTGPAIAVAAAITAIATAFTVFGKAAKEAKENYDRFIESLTKATSLSIVGAQIDNLAKKLQEQSDTGFGGSYHRFARGLLSRSYVFGTLFGVQSKEELEQQFKEATTLYETMLKGFGAKRDEANFNAGLFNTPATKGMGDTASQLSMFNTQVGTLIGYLRQLSQPDLQGAFGLLFLRGKAWESFGAPSLGGSFGNGVPGLGSLPGGEPNSGGYNPNFSQGASPAEQQALVNAANGVGTYVRGVEGAAGKTHKMAEDWRSVAEAVGNTVTLLANADSATARMLGNLVNIAGQVADANAEIAKTGKLSDASTIGLIASGVSLLAGAFGKSQAQIQFEQEQRENTAALIRLRTSLDRVAGGLTGNQYAAANAGIGALFANPGALIQGLGGLNTGAASGILRGAGLEGGLTQLKDLAKEIGITLNTSSLPRFLESLQQMKKALDELAFVQLRSFNGQLDLLNRQWSIANTTDPFAKMADLLKLIQGPEGAARLGGYLGSLDLSQSADRNAGRDYLLREIERARSGQLKTEDLGGLTVQQYLDFLSQFGDLLNQANEQIKATVENLRNFGKSLLLDQSLSPLTPSQQLAEAQRQYQEAYTGALGGDQAAANRIPDLARQFLSISQSYFGGGPGYTDTFAQIMRQVEQIATLFEGNTQGWETLEKPIGVVADNTKATADKLDIVIKVLAEVGKKVEEMGEVVGTRIDAQSRENRLAIEGAKL